VRDATTATREHGYAPGRMGLMDCRFVPALPGPRVSPAVQVVRDRCAPVRERSWALCELSRMHREDLVRLIAKSDSLLARSHGHDSDRSNAGESAGCSRTELQHSRVEVLLAAGRVPRRPEVRERYSSSGRPNIS
jgi:hypothetical protein